MASSRRWRRAVDVHDAAVRAFVTAVRAVPTARWQQPHAPGKWSPAEEALHVALSYEAGIAALEHGTPMQPRVSPWRARLLRALVLPVMLRTEWFPAATAPREVRPPDAAARALTPHAVATRIEDAAARVLHLAGTAGPHVRIMHAYFGRMTPLQGLGMLAAHTAHHTRAMQRRARATS